MRQSCNSEFGVHGKRWGSASSSPCRGGDRKGEARTDPRSANSERCFWMSLSRGEALWCSAMGVARRTVRHHPVGVKSYTRRDHPVIYVDVRPKIVGIRRTSGEFPHKLQPATVLRRLRPPGEPVQPQARKEVIPGTCHGSAPVPMTEALARSERAAGRRTLPRPAARFMSGPRLLGHRVPGSPAPRASAPAR